jgi:hypothetical protein
MHHPEEGTAQESGLSEAVIVTTLTLVALALGVVTIARTIDIPGDGPSHAMFAYQWASHPILETHGNWLPGFSYLAGLGLMIHPDPLLVPRVYNLVVGTLTIPAFYLLIRQVHGGAAATIGAASLAVLPLHVGLAASSLTEASFLFYTIAGISCLTRAVASSPMRMIPLYFFLIFLTLAEMTRYEAWPLAPLLVIYLYARSRDARVSAVAAVILAAFPLAWLTGNYFELGNFLYPYSRFSNPVEGGARVSLAVAIANLSAMANRHLGWLIASAALAGFTMEGYRAMRGLLGLSRIAYAFLVAAGWTMILQGAVTLGPALYDRYLLLGFTLALPMAALAYLAVFGSNRASVVLGVALFTGSLAMTFRLHSPLTFVTREKPTEVIEMVQWLRMSPYQNAAILTTKLDWQSTYLPLYAIAPEQSRRDARRFCGVSVWSSDDGIRGFIRQYQPALLVTQPEDAGDRAHLERILGRALPVAAPVHTIGHFQVYDISHLTADFGK